MKKIILFILTILFFCNYSFAETKKELRASYVLNSMQREYTTCYIFYKIIIEGLKKSDTKDTLIKGLEQSADVSLKLAFETGELMNMKSEVMSTRVKTEMKSQSDAIENNLSNISILLKKYGETCKKIIENKKQRIKHWEELAAVKFK
jgi:hypothetical protein